MLDWVVVAVDNRELVLSETYNIWVKAEAFRFTKSDFPSELGTLCEYG